MKKNTIIWISVAAALILAEVVFGILHHAKVERELELAHFEVRMSWFGSVEEYYLRFNLEEVWNDYHDIGYNGIDHPRIIRNIRLWETEGIAGWVDADIVELDRIMEKIETRILPDGFNRYSDQVIEDARNCGSVNSFVLMPST